MTPDLFAQIAGFFSSRIIARRAIMGAFYRRSVMGDDERALYEHITAEYRQALADAQWALARANAQCKAKDTIIAELTSLLDTATDA